MSTAIVKRETVPANSRLAKSERELAEALAGQFEAFYQTGVILDRIRREQEFKDAGYDSFAEYMNERMPQGIKKAQAYHLIKAKNIRPLLPEFSTNRGMTWSEWTIRPLTHKAFSKADQKRLGKKIATRVKNGEPFTASLVKQVCDEASGADAKKRAKKKQELKTTKTAAETMREIEWTAKQWMQSLGNVPGEFWSDIEEDDPGCMKDVISSLSSLVSFLRS